MRKFFNPSLAALALIAERHQATMGLLDAQNQYGFQQALSATGPSTNVIDHGTQRDMGIGEPMVVELTVDVALAGTTPTFQFALQTDSAVGFGTAVNVATSAQFSALAAAARTYLNLPPIVTNTTAGTTGIKRYTRLNFTLGGTGPTITVTSYLIPLRLAQAENVFPTGFLVD